MGRRKTSISDSTLEMIVSIDQRLTELIASDIPKRLHCIEEKLDYINPRLLTIEHVDRFYGGKIPHYKPTGKLIYFSRSELDDWLLHNRVFNEIDQDNEQNRCNDQESE